MLQKSCIASTNHRIIGKDECRHSEVLKSDGELFATNNK